MRGALAAGFGLGFLTAAQVGPIWLLCLRSTLRGGFRVGIAIGAGAAVIDLAYAALGVAGASRLLEIGALRIALGLAGERRRLVDRVGARPARRGLRRLLRLVLDPLGRGRVEQAARRPAARLS